MARVEADKFEQFGYPVAGAALPPRQPEGDVAGHGQVREEVAVLGDVADPAPLCRQAVDSAAADDDGAAVGSLEAGHDAQQRGLAGAGAAQQRGQLAGGQVEVDAGQDGRAAVRLAQAGQVHGGVHRAASWSVRMSR
ncbi:hypothetical protein Pflav_016490 [Phytohabitans flavus]|uniref:Uncharacterized protein n=1 Tax=Phytohabitans flavus TaxID=1076124 RepID=A0A6F8XN64_9ACTN|nr:hypothetical protein Pflav_016490 [Phytohabitans flavus]